jgi:hypothetical protein
MRVSCCGIWKDIRGNARPHERSGIAGIEAPLAEYHKPMAASALAVRIDLRQFCERLR